jgi:hypothetical protein
MANTYILIASNTVGSGGASTVTFSSIPSTYTDLVLKISARLSGSALSQSGSIYLNTAAADSSWRNLFYNGSTTGSSNLSGQNEIYAGEWPAATATSNTFSNTEIYIPNYRGSQQKSVSVDSNAENASINGVLNLIAGLSTKTAAITSITLGPYGGGQNIVQHSTFYLYGIQKS